MKETGQILVQSETMCVLRDRKRVKQESMITSPKKVENFKRRKTKRHPTEKKPSKLKGTKKTSPRIVGFYERGR